jgi:hypothetical protein
VHQFTGAITQSSPIRTEHLIALCAISTTFFMGPTREDAHTDEIHQADHVDAENLAKGIARSKCIP